MRVRQLIKEVYSNLGGRKKELVIIQGFRAFKVKRADKEATILQAIFDDYFSDKNKEVQERCREKIRGNLKTLLE